MKYYSSDFSQADTEYLYQQIEEIKPFVSDEALFLMEELPSLSGKRIVLKIKEGEMLFKVDSTAETILEAAKNAAQTAINMILSRKKKVEYKNKPLWV